VLAAVAQNGLALKDGSVQLRADTEVVLAAVAQNGLALKDASAELWTDKEVVFAAVAQNGLALKYASAELRADTEVVLAAVAHDGGALRFACRELKQHYGRTKRAFLANARRGYLDEPSRSLHALLCGLASAKAKSYGDAQVSARRDEDDQINDGETAPPRASGVWQHPDEPDQPDIIDVSGISGSDDEPPWSPSPESATRVAGKGGYQHGDEDEDDAMIDDSADVVEVAAPARSAEIIVLSSDDEGARQQQTEHGYDGRPGLATPCSEASAQLSRPRRSATASPRAEPTSGCGGTSAKDAAAASAVGDDPLHQQSAHPRRVNIRCNDTAISRALADGVVQNHNRGRGHHSTGLACDMIGPSSRRDDEVVVAAVISVPVSSAFVDPHIGHGRGGRGWEICSRGRDRPQGGHDTAAPIKVERDGGWPGEFQELRQR
jgi:hypothetical protein